MGWEVYPDGLHRLLVGSRDYAPPAIYITENGAAYPDVRAHDGRVHDPERLAYLAAHIARSRRAVEEGVPVQRLLRLEPAGQLRVGARATAKRFGIVYVDYPTLERVPKDSYYWYRDSSRACAARRGLPRSRRVDVKAAAVGLALAALAVAGAAGGALRRPLLGAAAHFQPRRPPARERGGASPPRREASGG